MDAVALLREELDRAQIELAASEVALIEATARANAAREAAARLEAAVAALNGESPPPAAPAFEEQTPEEFDAERQRRQRQREKEIRDSDPLAHVKCAGCGEAGYMSESIVTAPSGAPVRMLVCGKCGNQVL